MKGNKSKPVLSVDERAYVEYEHTSPFLSNEFLSLQAEWDQKLAASGFRDLEPRRKLGGDFTEVRLNSNRIKDEESFTSAKLSESYYRAAGIFLHETEFKRELDRDIFELWTEGKCYREISDAVGVSKDTAHRIVHQYRAILNRAIQERHPMFEEDAS